MFFETQCILIVARQQCRTS